MNKIAPDNTRKGQEEPTLELNVRENVKNEKLSRTQTRSGRGLGVI